MSSVLTQWWREARDASVNEREAVAAIAARLGESEGETRRLLGEVARVKLKGAPVRRSAPTAKPVARPVSESVNGRGVPAPLDTAAICDFYRKGRATLSPQAALKAVARRYNCRPHDARSIVAAVENEL
jgi:hypothetical protein